MAVLKSAKQEKFVQNLIAGMSRRQAYRDAYPASKRWKDEAVDARASNLFSDKVLIRYQEQQKQDALLTRWEKRKLLADIARSNKNDTPDRLRAIDTDNKMEGEYVSKVALDTDTDLNITIDYGGCDPP